METRADRGQMEGGDEEYREVERRMRSSQAGFGVRREETRSEAERQSEGEQERQAGSKQEVWMGEMGSERQKRKKGQQKGRGKKER